MILNPRVFSFITLSETKSFTRTGDLLHLTQPAISQHIKSIEEEFGVTLFEKNGRDLVLTKEGAYLLKYFKRMKNVDDAMHQAIDEYKQNRRRIDIGMTPTASEYLIPRLFTIIFSRTPRISVNFHVHPMVELYERMKTYEFDFSICDEKMADRKFLSKRIMDDRLGLIVSNKNHFAGESGVHMQDLRGEKFILRHGKSSTRILFEDWLTLHEDNISRYNVILEIESIPIIKELVSQNHGVTVLPLSVCKDEIKEGILKELEVTGFTIRRGTYLIYPEEAKESTIIRQIMISLGQATE